MALVGSLQFIQKLVSGTRRYSFTDWFKISYYFCLATYIISGDQLVGNQELGEDIRKRLQKFHLLPVFVMLGQTNDLETDFLSINVGFLYEFALLPSDQKVFAKVQEIVDFVGEVSIGQLKKKVGNEIAIYQLMFHQALRADLENELISDDTIVNASPLINSIIKNL